MRCMRQLLAAFAPICPIWPATAMMGRRELTSKRCLPCRAWPDGKPAHGRNALRTRNAQDCARADRVLTDLRNVDAGQTTQANPRMRHAPASGVMTADDVATPRAPLADRRGPARWRD